MAVFYRAAATTPTFGTSGTDLSTRTVTVGVPADVGNIRGANRLVFHISMRAAAGETVTGVTYGGVALTKIGSSSQNSTRVESWSLVGSWAASSSASLVVTLSAATTWTASVGFYFGTRTAVVGTVATAGATGTSCTVATQNARGDLPVTAAGALSTTALSVPPAQTSRQSSNGTGSASTTAQLLYTDAVGSAGLLPPLGATIANSADLAVVSYALREAPQVINSQVSTDAGAKATVRTASFVARGETNRALVVDVGINVTAANETVSSVTFGAQSLTLLTSVQVNSVIRLERWVLVAPVKTLQTITVTLSAEAYFGWVASTLTDVDQTTPLVDSETNSNDDVGSISTDQAVAQDAIAFSAGVNAGASQAIAATSGLGTFTGTAWTSNGSAQVGSIDTAWSPRNATAAGDQTVGFTGFATDTLAMISSSLNPAAVPSTSAPTYPTSKVLTTYNNLTNVQAGVTLTSPDATANYALVFIDSTSLPTALTWNGTDMELIVQIAGQAAIWGLEDPDVSGSVTLDATGGATAGRAAVLLLDVDTSVGVRDSDSDSDSVVTAGYVAAIASLTTVSGDSVFTISGQSGSVSNALVNGIFDVEADMRSFVKDTGSNTRCFNVSELVADGVTEATGTTSVYGPNTLTSGTVYVLSVVLAGTSSPSPTPTPSPEPPPPPFVPNNNNQTMGGGSSAGGGGTLLERRSWGRFFDSLQGTLDFTSGVLVPQARGRKTGGRQAAIGSIPVPLARVAGLLCPECAAPVQGGRCTSCRFTARR